MTKEGKIDGIISSQSERWLETMNCVQCKEYCVEMLAIVWIYRLVTNIYNNICSVYMQAQQNSFHRKGIIDYGVNADTNSQFEPLTLPD